MDMRIAQESVGSRKTSCRRLSGANGVKTVIQQAHISSLRDAQCRRRIRDFAHRIVRLQPKFNPHAFGEFRCRPKVSPNQLDHLIWRRTLGHRTCEYAHTRATKIGSQIDPVTT